MPDPSVTHTVMVAVGSNHATADTLIEEAIRLMSHFINGINPTEVLTTAPIGIPSGPFRNCLVTGRTSLDAPQLIAALKKAERDCGDRKSLRRRHIVMMDIDLLLHDDMQYHAEDWQRNYIRQLLPQTNIPLPLQK